MFEFSIYSCFSQPATFAFQKREAAFSLRKHCLCAPIFPDNSWHKRKKFSALVSMLFVIKNAPGLIVYSETQAQTG